MGHLKTPSTASGMRIGIYGGSFNPPHEGHLHVALDGLKRLKLHQIWVLVSPGNPLKDHTELLPLDTRMQKARALMQHPNIKITDLETQIGSTKTVDVISAIVTKRPNVRFVWVMGADNLSSFHNWADWHQIAHLVPLAVFDRPGYTHKALRSPAAHLFASSRERAQPNRPMGRTAPRWRFLFSERHQISSTAIRKVQKLSHDCP